MWSRRAVVGFTLVCALSATACSSSSHSASPTTTTSRPTTTIDKVTQVRQLCEQSNTDLGAAAQKAFGGQQPTAGQWQTFMVGTALPLIIKRLDAIRQAPAGSTPKIRQAINAGQQAINTAYDDPQKLDPGTKAPFDEYDSLVTAAGIPECGVGG